VTWSRPKSVALDAEAQDEGATTASDISHRRRYIPFPFYGGYDRGSDDHLTAVSPSLYLYTIYCVSTSIVFFGLMLLRTATDMAYRLDLRNSFGSGLAIGSLCVKDGVFERANDLQFLSVQSPALEECASASVRVGESRKSVVAKRLVATNAMITYAIRLGACNGIIVVIEWRDR